MAVTYRSSGTIVANGGAGVDMSSALPSGLAIGDIIIFQGLDADNEHFDLAMPDDWGVVFSDNANGNAGGTFAWKRYDGTEVDWVFDTPSGAGQLVMGVLHAFQGVIKTGTPHVILNSQVTVNVMAHSAGSGTNDATTLAVSFISIEDNVAVTKVDTSGTFTERDNQTTTVGSDGRLICSTSVSTGTVEQTYTTGSNEYSLSLLLKLIPDTDRPTIVPNTADAHDFGVDDTPTLEFTGSDANDNDLEYQIQIGNNDLSIIELDKLSVTPDLLFTNTTDGADTHPFDQPDLIDYTVQDPIQQRGYDDVNDADSGHLLYTSAVIRVGQSFDGIAKDLKTAKFYARKVGSPTGNITVKLFAHSGTFGTSSVPTGSVLATTNTVDVTTVGTSYEWVEFTFASAYTLSAGTKYVITLEYTGSNSANCLEVAYDSVSASHEGNKSIYISSWTASASDDLLFRLNFVGGIDDGTWYWRARAIDPTGTNEWSDWTTIRSFEIGGVPDPPRGNKMRSFIMS